MSIHLVTIDGQNDFCDLSGSLYVKDADKDMERLAKMIRDKAKFIDDIHETMDLHRRLDIAHPIFWRDSKGENPPPFTIITADDVRNGKWQVFTPSLRKYVLGYVETLEKNGRYPLCVWPEHCLVGTWGSNIFPVLNDAFEYWEKTELAHVNFVNKGMNFKTEHYSAIQADVPDPDDPTTQLNTDFIQILQSADQVGISGEALSHCVANTFLDVANNFGEENIKRLVLLEDCSSRVWSPDSDTDAIFEKMADNFITEMTGRGMTITTSDRWPL